MLISRYTHGTSHNACPSSSPTCIASIPALGDMHDVHTDLLRKQSGRSGRKSMILAPPRVYAHVATLSSPSTRRSHYTSTSHGIFGSQRSLAHEKLRLMVGREMGEVGAGDVLVVDFKSPHPAFEAIYTKDPSHSLTGAVWITSHASSISLHVSDTGIGAGGGFINSTVGVYSTQPSRWTV